MHTYLIIKDNEVINTVLWDGVSDWAAPDGTTAIPAPEGVWIGWTFVGGEWVAPQPSTPEPEDPAKASARVKLSALGLTDEEIAAMVGI